MIRALALLVLVCLAGLRVEAPVTPALGGPALPEALVPADANAAGAEAAPSLVPVLPRQSAARAFRAARTLRPLACHRAPVRRLRNRPAARAPPAAAA